jgi:hypothetical protein
MRNRAFRPVITILSLLLIGAVPAQASPVSLSDIVQVYRGAGNQGMRDLSLELRLASDDNKKGNSTSTPSGPGSNKTAPAPSAPASGTVSLPTQSGLQQVPGGNVQQPRTEVIEDVTTENCDCPPIPLVGGGFPKWIFLFAAVPLICFTGICGGHDNTCVDTGTCTTPTPTPTPPQVPEPASLLLFGSGLLALGAGARRRYSRARLSASVQTTTEN